MARRKKRRARKLDETIGLGIIGILLVTAVAYRVGERIHRVGWWPAVTIAIAVAIALITAYFGWRFFRVLYRAYKRQQRFIPYHHADLVKLLRMDPFEFEKYAGRAFESKGYRVEVTRAVGDGGIDLRLQKDGIKTVAQIKRYGPHHPVGEPEVRDFYGSFANTGAEEGILLTLSGFTLPAREWAKSRPLSLIGGKEALRFLGGQEVLPWYKLFKSRALRAPEERAAHIAPGRADAAIPEEQPYQKFWSHLR